MTRPRVGISACLLGEAVRYDGGHKESAAALELAGAIDWVSVCPEVEVGMHVPREPLILLAAEAAGRNSDLDASRRLERSSSPEELAEGLRLIGAESGRDWTDAMQAWARSRLGALGRVDGWVLKSRSPSCGLAAPLRSAPGHTARGLFAQALRAFIPDLPCVEEDALADPVRRKAFLDAVRAHFDAG